MEEFIDQRNQLLQEICEFRDPDFAQPEVLPVNARLSGDPEEEVEDQWKDLGGMPLMHMTGEEWNRCYQTIEQVFIGPYPSEKRDRGPDERSGQPNEMTKTLETGKGDIMFDPSESRRRSARGKVRFDIDSVLALFNDLSVVKSVLSVTIVPLPMKNLQSDVHIIHNGVPLHWIPHFHFGRFGHDPTFDVFMFLPAIYNKGIRRQKNNLFNHVSEDVISEFMNKCFLPAVKQVLDDGEAQEWDFDYQLNKAKSNAIGLEGHIHGSERDRFRQQLHFDLDADHISPVWKICRKRLSRAISRNQLLRAFKGFQLFINAKNFKYRSGNQELSSLMRSYKTKVWSSHLAVHPGTFVRSVWNAELI